MCCFSGIVKAVADTNIFARASKEGRQYLVYSMRIDADQKLAMILPIPVPKASKEDAVRFISLEKYPEFFADMAAGFPANKNGSGALSKDAGRGDLLKVVKVGSFDASFVPAVKDFGRLDERYRLPADVWDKLPMYKDFGFAVFQLSEGKQKVHPMAFEFPRANPKQLFFPTVHIHDGTVKAKADFDHFLFCQTSGREDLMDWKESPQPAKLFMKKIELAQGILEPDGHCYLRQLRGEMKNEDTVV